MNDFERNQSGLTLFVWNDRVLHVRLMPKVSTDEQVHAVLNRLRREVHGSDDEDDPRWQTAPGHIEVIGVMLDADGNRSIFDDVDE